MSNIIDAKVENILHDIFENYEISNQDMELLCWYAGRSFPPKRNTDFERSEYEYSKAQSFKYGSITEELK